MIAVSVFRKIFVFLLIWSAVCGASQSVCGQVETDEPNAAVAEFEKGQQAHERGDLTLALTFYEKALVAEPEFPEAEYQRGAAYQQLGKLFEAEKAFRRAAELRPDWSLPPATLGALLIKENKYAEAETFLIKAVALDAANSPALVGLTELRLNTKSAPEKLRELLVQIKRQTDGKANAPVLLWAARAALERSLGDNAAAKLSVSRALQINPNNLSARLERVEILLAENDFAAALDDVKLAVKSTPNDLQAQLLLARAYAANNQSAESLKVLDALTADERKLTAVTSLRDAIIVNNATDTGSIADLEKTLINNEKNAPVLGRLCVLQRIANPAKALEYCRRASELEPNNVAHAVGYGAALVQARQFENAITLLRRILIVAPDNYTARGNLATALYEAKRFAESIIEFNRLINSKPNVAATYFFLATAEDATGNYIEAMAAYQKFLTIADANQNQLEIDKVKLRLPGLERQIEKGAGKNKKPRT